MATLTSLTVQGSKLGLPSGTTAQRPASPTAGMTRFNTDLASYETYNGTSWTTIGTDTLYPGATSWNPATSGYLLATRYSWLPSGYYWIKGPNMKVALQMYVDMTASREGGGWDYFVITGGKVADRARIIRAGTSISGGDGGFHSGTPLGLDLVYPRSPHHWESIVDFCENVYGQDVNDFFNSNIGPVTRTTSNSAGSLSGDYHAAGATPRVMRSPRHWPTGAHPNAEDWLVPDRGRWWLRNSTYTEPNGDYAGPGFLGNRGISRSFNAASNELTFNDLSNYSQTTGTLYLVSTNAKP